MRFLLTGACSQIGKAIIDALLHSGHSVIGTASSEASLEKIRPECERLLFDLKDYEKSLEDLNLLLLKPIDGLILNACTRWERLKRFGDLNLEASLSYVDVNLRGNLWLLHRIIKEQTKHGLGRNLFISSVSASMGTSRYGAYCLVKSGMEGLFRNLAVDYGHKNLFFNSLRPGIIATERHESLRQRHSYNDTIVSRIPSGHIGSPTNVAQAALLLLEKDSYINGTHLEVSGGLPLFRTDSFT